MIYTVSILTLLPDAVIENGVVGRCWSIYAVSYRSTELPVNIYCINLDVFDSCCCVSNSDVAVIMLQLCLFLMVAVTGYRVLVDTTYID